MVKILFVCLGNICRSPTAEGVFRHLVRERGLEDQVEIDSAGTGDWHVGRPPDLRSQEEARRRGIDLSTLRARTVHCDDYGQFDYVIAMDEENLRNLRAGCPKAMNHKLYRFTDFAPELGIRAVPDPYYDEDEGFRKVYDIIESSARGLLAALEADGFQGGGLNPARGADAQGT
jgi:protein-tyrosine phosphatase